MTERRKLERFRLKVPARIQVVTQHPDVEETAPALNLMTEDICSGGAFFSTSCPLTEGTEVKIDMVLDLDKIRGLEGKGPLIRLRGTVSRSESTGMAICFGRYYEILAQSDA